MKPKTHSRAPLRLDERPGVVACFGRVPDSLLAAAIGVCHQTIWKYRRKLGIPAVRYTSVDEAVALMRQHISPELLQRGRFPSDPLNWRRAPPRLDARQAILPFVPALGKEPDEWIAKLAGVPVKRVRRFRNERGIPAWPRRNNTNGRPADWKERVLSHLESESKKEPK